MRFREDIPSDATHKYIFADVIIAYYRYANGLWSVWTTDKHRWIDSYASNAWSGLVPINKTKDVGQKMCDAF